MGRGLWRKGVSERRERWLSHEQNRSVTLDSTNGGFHGLSTPQHFKRLQIRVAAMEERCSGLTFDE